MKITFLTAGTDDEHDFVQRGSHAHQRGVKGRATGGFPSSSSGGTTRPQSAMASHRADSMADRDSTGGQFGRYGSAQLLQNEMTISQLRAEGDALRREKEQIRSAYDTYVAKNVKFQICEGKQPKEPPSWRGVFWAVEGVLGRGCGNGTLWVYLGGQSGALISRALRS